MCTAQFQRITHCIPVLNRNDRKKKMESNAHTRTPTQINENPVHYTPCGDPRYPDEHAPLRSFI